METSEIQPGEHGEDFMEEDEESPERSAGSILHWQSMILKDASQNLHLGRRHLISQKYSIEKATELLEEDRMYETSLHDTPDEILGCIFQKLNGSDLKECRLVCQKWNMEIKNHARLSLIVTASNSANTDFVRKTGVKLSRVTRSTGWGLVNELPNLHFIQQVNRPKSLYVTDLKKDMYIHLLKQHQYRHVQRLKISCQISKMFLECVMYPCLNLKVLKISENTLKSCDFQENMLNHMDDSCLYNLQELTIYIDWENEELYERYDIFDGQKIAWNSKNITFLLRNIASRQMKKVKIETDTDLLFINCCVGRKEYRFEDFDLQAFICKHGHSLEEIKLDIPSSMCCKLPTKFRQHKYNYNISAIPKNLKKIFVKSSIGDVYYDPMNVINSELLKFDESFYDDVHDPENFYFWATLYLEQRCLVKCEFAYMNLVVMSNLYQIVNNNKSTLRHLSVYNIMPETLIDGRFFQDAKLVEAYFYAPLTPIESAEEISSFINTHLLPQTLNLLKLINIKLDREEYLGLIQLDSLKHFECMVWSIPWYDLGQIDNFAPVLENLSNKCNYLHLGTFSEFKDAELRKLLESLKTNYCPESGFYTVRKMEYQQEFNAHRDIN